MSGNRDGHLQGSMYDKLFKENMQQNLPGIMKYVLNLDVTTIEELQDDVQFTKERKTDLLKKVIDKNGNTYVLHVEYQTYNYKHMHYRMAEYSIMLQRKHELPVKQFVIYIGPGKANMPITIDTKDHKFRYSMTVLSSVDHNLFLKSEKIEEKMLAILGKIEQQDSKSVLEQILMDIKHAAIDELSAERYLQQLHVLVKLRNLGQKLEEVMINVASFFREEEDPLYLRGQKKGKIENQKEIALNLKNMGMPIADIVKGTSLSIEEVEAL
jgi:predicted transposase/invertase (TIGR01784 family)